MHGDGLIGNCLLNCLSRHCWDGPLLEPPHLLLDFGWLINFIRLNLFIVNFDGPFVKHGHALSIFNWISLDVRRISLISLLGGLCFHRKFEQVWILISFRYLLNLICEVLLILLDDLYELIFGTASIYFRRVRILQNVWVWHAFGFPSRIVPGPTSMEHLHVEGLLLYFWARVSFKIHLLESNCRVLLWLWIWLFFLSLLLMFKIVDFLALLLMVER